MNERFKVVTEPGGGLVANHVLDNGHVSAHHEDPSGLTEDQADKDARRRDELAEVLGIHTRYVVVPL